MKWRSVTLTGLAGFILLGSPARGEKAAHRISDVTTIQDEEGHARILFNWNAPIDAQHVAIRRAVLHFDVTGDIDTRSIRLVVHPITKTWNPATVTWTRGWSEPGGDFDSDQGSYAEIDLKRGGGAYVDVTNVIKQTLETRSESYGLIVTTVPEESIGIPNEDLSRFAGLSNANLEVSWRKTTPPPREISQ